jgi:hypothetical protein
MGHGMELTTPGMRYEQGRDIQNEKCGTAGWMPITDYQT